MLEAEGTVIAVEGRHAVIQSRTRGGCGQCAHQSSCGVGVLSKALPGARQQLSLEMDPLPVVGQTVVLGIPEQGLVKAALWLYLVPLLGLLGGALLVVQLWPGGGDPAALLGGSVGALAGWLLSRFVLRRQPLPQVRLVSTKPLARIPVKCEE